MKESTIRLLILNDSRSEAERLISMLHNAGRPVRATHVDSEMTLVKLLDEKVWDLMIGLDTTQSLPPIEAIKHIRRLSKDIPLILQTDNEGTKPILDGMKLGAVEVVRLDEDQHLLLVIQREYNNREQRAQRRIMERRLNEIERRNQQLLDSSRDAIAYIQDGMFLYVNDSFAEYLHYGNRDDLECMPVIDVIATEDQERVKKFLKQFRLKASDDDNAELKFTSIMGNGKPKPVQLRVGKSNYDDESCIRFICKHSVAGNSKELDEQMEKIKYQDGGSGLYNRTYLIERMETIVDQAITQQIDSTICCIGIENFIDIVHERMGAQALDAVTTNIANYAKTLISKNAALCRFSEDSIVLLMPKTDASSALKQAQNICSKLADHIIDIEGKTLQFNYRIGLAIINDTTSNAKELIDHGAKALELAKADAKPEDNALVRMYEPETRGDNQKVVVANSVQHALDENKFKLLFQPIVSLRGAEYEHYEVLLRMVDDDNEEISPFDFLSAAANIGATTKVDRWSILEAIKALSKRSQNESKTRLIINLSKESMHDKSLPPWLGVAFKAAKVPANSVIFQLREIDINNHLNVAATFADKISALGSECCISNFGCVLNPLNALKTVSANFIKLDGSFTQEILNNGENQKSLSELASLLHQAEKITIVPFVENANVLSKLWQSGVHYIQGYYLQGPSAEMNYDFDMET